MSNLSPIVFAQQAEQFLAAAKREFSLAHSRMSFPAYFLVGRAIELALKSFLLLRGRTEKELKRISHDLERALADANALGLGAIVQLTTEREHALLWVNHYYESKDLEYPKTGYKSYPAPELLLDCVGQILAGIQSELRAWRPA